MDDFTLTFCFRCERQTVYHQDMYEERLVRVAGECDSSQHALRPITEQLGMHVMLLRKRMQREHCRETK